VPTFQPERINFSGARERIPCPFSTAGIAAYPARYKVQEEDIVNSHVEGTLGDVGRQILP
jgi:hypothetical protein